MNARILVVEDDLDHRNICRTILTHSGFAVGEANDGEEAIRKAREEQPDLILTDVSIPMIDGWEATRTLQGEALTSAIPIVALTAHALPVDGRKAVEVGCDAYLTKPLTPRRLVEEVKRLLRRTIA
jgi:two-component system, cell cycle response regulator DivK